MSALGKQHRDVGTLSTGGNGPIRSIRRRWPQERLAEMPLGGFEPNMLDAARSAEGRICLGWQRR
jgi:hypothetical protein